MYLPYYVIYTYDYEEGPKVTFLTKCDAYEEAYQNITKVLHEKSIVMHDLAYRFKIEDIKKYKRITKYIDNFEQRYNLIKDDEDYYQKFYDLFTEEIIKIPGAIELDNDSYLGEGWDYGIVDLNA
jgi:hypothetical protein